MANDPTVPVNPRTRGIAPMPPFDAAAAIEQLHQIIALVPGFEPPDSKVWLSIRRKSGFPDAYIESAATIVDASPEIRATTHFDETTLRDGVNLSNGIRAQITEALNFTYGLRFTLANLRQILTHV